MAKKEHRQRRVVVMFSEREFEQLRTKQEGHPTATTISEYVRAKVLDTSQQA